MLKNVGLSLAIVVGLMPLALLGILGLAAVVLVTPRWWLSPTASVPVVPSP